MFIGMRPKIVALTLLTVPIYNKDSNGYSSIFISVIFMGHWKLQCPVYDNLAAMVAEPRSSPHDVIVSGLPSSTHHCAPCSSRNCKLTLFCVLPRGLWCTGVGSRPPCSGCVNMGGAWPRRREGLGCLEESVPVRHLLSSR